MSQNKNTHNQSLSHLLVKNGTLSSPIKPIHKLKKKKKTYPQKCKWLDIFSRGSKLILFYSLLLTACFYNLFEKTLCYSLKFKAVININKIKERSGKTDLSYSRQKRRLGRAQLYTCIHKPNPTPK